MRAARRRTVTVILVIGLSLLWAAVAFAVGAAPANAGSDHAVEIVDFAYAPAELTIEAGDTVTWTNLDAAGHTATASDGSWNTGVLERGESASITFSVPGTYEYLCIPHPTMTGRVTVVAASAPTAAPAPRAGSGSLPDVAMSAERGPGSLAVLGIALLALAGIQAVVRVRRELGQD